MTNWKKEAEKIFGIQEQSLRDLREKAVSVKNLQDQDILKKIQKDYENIIEPGFKILDKFKVKEKLQEIFDQIWKVGNIIKRPKDINEFIYVFEYSEYTTPGDLHYADEMGRIEVYTEPKIVCCKPKEKTEYIQAYAKGDLTENPFFDNQNNNDRFITIYPEVLARYIFISPVYTFLQGGISSNESVDSGETFSDSCCYKTKRKDILEIFTDTQKIFIGNALKPQNISISVKEPDNVINKFINDKLALICINAKDYSRL